MRNERHRPPDDRFSSIDYPPKTQENWLRLLTLAGFSQSFADSVFRELGYDGYSHAAELPRVYVSAAGESENEYHVSIDDSLLMTQRILAGLEAHRGRDHVRKADASDSESGVGLRQHTVEERAMAFLVANRGCKMTKQEVAKSIGCHSKSLSPSNAPTFHVAYMASQSYGNPPVGSKSPDGDFESFSGPLRGPRVDDDKE